MSIHETTDDEGGGSQEISERLTVLDDRILHMTREEAQAELDKYIRMRGLDRGC